MVQTICITVCDHLLLSGFNTLYLAYHGQDIQVNLSLHFMWHVRQDSCGHSIFLYSCVLCLMQYFSVLQVIFKAKSKYSPELLKYRWELWKSLEWWRKIAMYFEKRWQFVMLISLLLIFKYQCFMTMVLRPASSYYVSKSVSFPSTSTIFRHSCISKGNISNASRKHWPC